jgi:hypothetical protein
VIDVKKKRKKESIIVSEILYTLYSLLKAYALQYILHSQHIPVGAGQVSSAQLPSVASDYRVRHVESTAFMTVRP